MKPLALAAVLLLASLAAPLSTGALGLSYGGGGSLNFSPVTFSGVYGGTPSQVTSQASATAVQFFDATYIMVQVGYFLNRGSTEPTSAITPTTSGFAAMLTGLSLGLAARLPIRIGPVEVFPLIGVEYVLNLSYTDDRGDDLRATLSASTAFLDELWLKGGLGVDVLLGSLFLRPMVVAGYKPFGAATVTSAPSSGTLTLAYSAYTIDVYLLFGYRF